METRYEIDVERGAIRVTLGSPLDVADLAATLDLVAADPEYSPELAWIFDARAVRSAPSDVFPEAVRLMARQALLFLGNEQAIVSSEPDVHRTVRSYQRQMEAVGMRVELFHELDEAEDWLSSRRAPAAVEDHDQRRTFRRVEFMSSAVLIPAPDDDAPESEHLPAEIVNLGCGGALVRTFARVDEGSRWRIRILNPVDPEGDADEVVGSVRRTEVKLGATFLGVEFERRLLAVHTGLPSRLATPLDVLVVDDEPEVQFILERFFRVHGCAVRTAPDGGAALEVLREAQPDLILLDLRMPGMNGLELLDRIRDEALEVGPVWAFSGYVTDEEATEAMRLGAVGFMNKPLDFGFLQRIISVSPLL